MSQIIENGITYYVFGDYPPGTLYSEEDPGYGRYVKYPKPVVDVKTIFFKKIIRKLPVSKQKEIWAAAAVNSDVNNGVQMIIMNGTGRNNEPWVIGFFTGLVTEGVITQNQADGFLE